MQDIIFTCLVVLEIAVGVWVARRFGKKMGEDLGHCLAASSYGDRAEYERIQRERELGRKDPEALCRLLRAQAAAATGAEDMLDRIDHDLPGEFSAGRG